MKRINRFITLLGVLGYCATGYAGPISVVPGEWQTTSQATLPQGPMTLRQKICVHDEGVRALLMRQQGEQCDPWRQVSSTVDGTTVLRTTCTQTGPAPGSSLTLHVQATVSVAPDGRSAHGSVEASGKVDGMAFTSPPSQFTSRYLGACPGR